MKKKNILVASLVIAGLLGFLAMTNPSKEQFKAWIVAEANARQVPGIEPNSSEVYGYFASNLMSDRIIDETVERKDYVFFSAYSTQLPYWSKPDTFAIGLGKRFFIVRQA